MKVNLRKIEGIWNNGFSLDKHTLHSTYTGDNQHGHPTFDTKRTEMGECLYQLKYKGDFAQVSPIAYELCKATETECGFISFVLPIPPSKERSKQPVIEVSRQVGANLRVPCIENMLLKNASAEQMKNINSRKEKVEALCNKLSFQDVLQDGQYNVLIVDDLYDTGATLEAATLVLREYTKIKEIYVATITRKN